MRSNSVLERLVGLINEAYPPEPSRQRSPLPEAIDGGEWKITPTEHVKDSQTILNPKGPGGEMIVPVSDSEKSRLIRAHEMGHTALSPRKPVRVQAPMEVVQLCEDARIQAQLQRVGFEFTEQLLEPGDYQRLAFELRSGKVNPAMQVGLLAATHNSADGEQLSEMMDPKFVEMAGRVHARYFESEEQLDDFDLSTSPAALEIMDRVTWDEQNPGEPYPGDEEGEPQEGEGEGESSEFSAFGEGEGQPSGEPGEGGEGEGKGGEGQSSTPGSQPARPGAGMAGGGIAGDGSPMPPTAPGKVPPRPPGPPPAAKKPGPTKPADAPKYKPLNTTYKPTKFRSLPSAFRPWAYRPHKAEAMKIEITGVPGGIGGGESEAVPDYGGFRRLSDLTTDEALQQIIESATDEGRKWGTMVVKEIPRPRRLPNKVMGKKVRVSEEGLLRNPQRLAACDARVFARTRRKKGGGTLLCDNSGSMSLSTVQLEAIIKSLPAAVVAHYSGNGDHGELRIVAKQGKMCEEDGLRAFGGYNVVDVPALEWLAKQKEPRIWMSDGWVTGIHDGLSKRCAIEAAKIIKRARIVRIPDIQELLEKLGVMEGE